MKSIHVFASRVGFLALAVLGAASSTLADPVPTIEAYGVDKRITYLQTSSTAPSSPSLTLGDPNGPYFFEATVSGSYLDLLCPAPALAGVGDLVLKGTGEWGFENNFPATNGFGAKGTMDSAFPNGNFTLNNLTGPGSVTLNLGPSDAYPADIPAVTNGTWVGEALQVNAVTGMTLCFNNFSAYDAAGMIEFHLYTTSGASITGDLASALTLQPNSDLPLLSYTIQPGDLIPGQTYFAELSFGSFTTFDELSIDNAFGYALYQNMTGFSISAIPEPSTYAAAAGFLAFGLVLWRRRVSGRCV